MMNIETGDYVTLKSKMLFYHENASKYSEEEYKQKYNGGKELFGNCFLSLWDIR